MWQRPTKHSKTLKNVRLMTGLAATNPVKIFGLRRIVPRIQHAIQQWRGVI